MLKKVKITDTKLAITDLDENEVQRTKVVLIESIDIALLSEKLETLKPYIIDLFKIGSVDDLNVHLSLSFLECDFAYFPDRVRFKYAYHISGGLIPAVLSTPFILLEKESEVDEKMLSKCIVYSNWIELASVLHDIEEVATDIFNKIK